ncbi:MAG TPA: HAMP domain-containing sensor histidine kinase [Steroidobacteraceae bacterium]
MRSSLPDSEARLRARITELEQLLQARDEFLSIAAHELRNPMHSLLLQVSAALQLARQQGATPLARRLERVQHIVDRYVKRASLLLDVGRMNANRMHPQLESVDFAEVVREVVESYSPEAAFNRSPLSLHTPTALNGRWDRLALEQIVSNLISNAIKFGAGASIDVSLESKQDNSVQFQVHDRGIGIAEVDQERIFGRFERLAAQPGHPAGAGVGLWLVRGLVESHGGTIEVQSEPAKGATFTVILPLDAGSTAGARHDEA